MHLSPPPLRDPQKSYNNEGKDSRLGQKKRRRLRREEEGRKGGVSLAVSQLHSLTARSLTGPGVSYGRGRGRLRRRLSHKKITP